MSFLKSAVKSIVMERLLFAIVVVGLVLTVYGGIQFIYKTYQQSNNIAQKVHDSGEDLNIQSTSEGRGLVAADMARRELIRERGQMIMLAGIGIILLGIGWLGYDFRRSQFSDSQKTPASDDAEMLM